MDETDIRIALMLLVNSRRSYREIGDRLELSANAVYKRVQGLIENCVIRGYTAKLSLKVLAAHNVIVWGRTDRSELTDLLTKLGVHESIYWVTLASGNYFFIGTYLRSIDELGPVLDFIRVTAGISEPTVGIVPSVKEDEDIDELLTPLDYEIVDSLRDDAKKPLSEVSEEIGVSTRTVRRRLSTLEKHGWIDLSILWYPEASNDIITLFELDINPSVDKRDVLGSLRGELSPSHILTWDFNNLPNKALMITWTPTMGDLRRLRASIEEVTGIFGTVSYIIYMGRIFPTWRDIFINEKIQENIVGKS